jgi:hypothetical protein
MLQGHMDEVVIDNYLKGVWADASWRNRKRINQFRSLQFSNNWMQTLKNGLAAPPCVAIHLETQM